MKKEGTIHLNRILSYPQAINEALFQSMKADNKVIVMGQGVNDSKRILGTTKGLVEEFGENRIFDTPVAEDGMTGVAIGMAMNGFKVIHNHIRMDFLLLAMNQLINMAAKVKYMYNGAVRVPMVIRATIGKSWGQGPQHSQSLYPLFLNIPGIKIVAPVIPQDAKSLLIEAIQDPDPVLFIEHRHLYYQKGKVLKEQMGIPFNKANRFLKLGGEPWITLVGVSQMAIECLRASKYLEDNGIDSDVIAIQSLAPLNIENILESVKTTGKLVFVDCAWQTCGLGAEMLTMIIELTNNTFAFKRMGFAQTTCPTTPSLEKDFYPNAIKIAKKAFSMLSNEKLEIKRELEIEEIEFKGPF